MVLEGIFVLVFVVLWLFPRSSQFWLLEAITQGNLYSTLRLPVPPETGAGGSRKFHDSRLLSFLQLL